MEATAANGRNGDGAGGEERPPPGDTEALGDGDSLQSPLVDAAAAAAAAAIAADCCCRRYEARLPGGGRSGGEGRGGPDTTGGPDDGDIGGGFAALGCPDVGGGGGGCTGGGGGGKNGNGGCGGW